MIEHCPQLQELLSRPGLCALVGRIRELPPRPRVFARLQVLLSHSNVNAKQLCTVVEADAVITARVLLLANGVQSYGRSYIRNLEQAIIRLGFTGLRDLVLCAEVFAGWNRMRAGGVDLNAMQDHVQRVAGITDALAAGSAWRDEAVLAAVLHDIGYWVLAQECPAELKQAAALALAEDIPMHAAETRVLGACHAEIGAYLLGLWGMPGTLVEAVAYHHVPQRAGIRGFNTLAALVVALSLSGTDDSDAFISMPRRNDVVGPDFLDQLADRPFDWADASRLAMDRLADLECVRRGRGAIN